MAAVNLPLPQDNAGQRILGLLDPASGTWSLLRARNVAPGVTIAGQPTQLGDLGVQPVGVDGTGIVVMPTPTIATGFAPPNPGNAGGQLSVAIQAVMRAAGGVWDPALGAHPSGGAPGDQGLAAQVLTLWDVTSGHYQHARSANGMIDNDSGQASLRAVMQAWNGAGYDRLLNDSNKNLRVGLRDSANTALTFLSGRLPADILASDGNMVTQGSKGDAAWDGVAVSPSMMAILKLMITRLKVNASGAQWVDNAPQAAVATTALGNATAGADSAYTFTQQIKYWIVVNNTNVPLYLNFDTAAYVGSYMVPPGGMAEERIPVTVMHFYSALGGTLNASNCAFFLLGWA